MKENERTFEKMKENERKIKKMKENEGKRSEEVKIRKRGPKGVLPETAQKWIFYIRTVKREIVTKLRPKKNQILSPGERERKRKRKRKRK